MAKKGTDNRTAKVREYLLAHPDQSNTEVLGGGGRRDSGVLIVWTVALVALTKIRTAVHGTPLEQLAHWHSPQVGEIAITGMDGSGVAKAVAMGFSSITSFGPGTSFTNAATIDPEPDELASVSYSTPRSMGLST